MIQLTLTDTKQTMPKQYRHPIFNRGFTIVELLIVIVIIGILATITFIAYSGIQRSATDSSAKDTLSKAVNVMKLAGVQSGSYGTSFPSTIKVSEGIGIALAEVSDSSTFCVNVTTQKYDDILWHADESGTIAEGLCSGDLINSSIIGDYNETAKIPPSYSSGTAYGDGGGLIAKTNDDWTSVTISWNQVPNADHYELQYRTGSGSWYIRRIADCPTCGNANPSYPYLTDPLYSALIPGSSTSQIWSGSYVMPGTSTTTMQYRLRSYDSGNVASSWNTVSLTPPLGSSMSTIPSLTITPSNDWSNVTIAWTKPNHNNMPSPIAEVQYRSGAGSWYIRRIADCPSCGNANPTYPYSTDPLFSAMIPYSTSSLTWSGSYVMPQTTGITFEYRVRQKSSNITGLFSNWTTTSLTKN